MQELEKEEGLISQATAWVSFIWDFQRNLVEISVINQSMDFTSRENAAFFCQRWLPVKCVHIKLYMYTLMKCNYC